MQYTSQHNYGFAGVLRLLEGAQEGYTSGSSISEELGTSRVAVWKHIKKLRSLGYVIKSQKGLGYRLDASTRLPLPWEVCRGLQTRWIGKKIHYLDSVDSTQSYAQRLAQNDGESGTVVIAGRQTRGRGRMNRRWFSPDGGVWMSVVLRPVTGAAMTLLPLAASVALSSAAEDTLGIRPELKWPNDLMIRRRKAAGILADASMTSNRIDCVVLGVGINFGINAGQVERNIDALRPRVASLTSPSERSNPVPLIRSFLHKLEQSFESLAEGKSRRVVREWTMRSSTIGRRVTLRTDGGIIRGMALRIDQDGALVVQQGKTIHRILVGDVVG